MNDLIDNIVAFLKAAMIDSLSAKSVHKGFGAEDPDQIAMHDYPIVEVDDGGERVDSEIAANTQERIYKVAIFMAVI